MLFGYPVPPRKRAGFGRQGSYGEAVATLGRDQLAGTAARAGERLRRLAPVAAPRLVEIALAVALGVLLALAALKLFAPLPTPRTPAVAVAAAAAPAASSARNPFAPPPGLEAAPASGAAAPEAAETTLDLALHGTWVDPERGAAVIRLPGGAQKTFVLGDAICCGATLEGVYPDQVIISRGGARESLRLANKRPVTAQAVPSPAAEAAPARPPVKALSIAEIVRVQPLPDGSAGLRFALHPVQDRRAFEALGLRDGDILLSVNGAPAPRSMEAVAQLLAGLAGAETLAVTVERNGAPVAVNISLNTES